MPNSSKYQMELIVDGKFTGMAAWGYGIRPKDTPRHLVGDEGRVEDYLELCRFFVTDDAPPHAASKFLSITHRLLKKHTNRKWLYTYAAGFQGLIGTIYQASGYWFVGTRQVSSLLWVPQIKGLVHIISLYHRYKCGSIHPKHWQKLYPGSKQWCGLNFRYIYWLCDDQERDRLMEHATFQRQPNATKADLKVWTVDHLGNKETVDPDLAKGVPIVKLPTRRARSVGSQHAHLPGVRGRCKSDPRAPRNSTEVEEVHG